MVIMLVIRMRMIKIITIFTKQKVGFLRLWRFILMSTMKMMKTDVEKIHQQNYAMLTILMMMLTLVMVRVTLHVDRG